MEQNNIEIWKPVVGYEGRYEVSSFGRVKALARCLVRANGRPHPQKERLFTQHMSNCGYMRVGLNALDNSKRTNCSVHRIVCEAFHGSPEGTKRFVNHKDLNKSNNRSDNLEWVTNQENMDHAAANGVYNPLERTEPCSRQKVSKAHALALKAEIDEAIVTGTLDIQEIANRHGLTKALVNAMANGLTWSTVQKRHRVKMKLNNPFISTTVRVKMTPEKVAELRSLASSLSYAELGRRFGIANTTARGIVLGLYWKVPT